MGLLLTRVYCFCGFAVLFVFVSFSLWRRCFGLGFRFGLVLGFGEFVVGLLG